MRRLLTRVLLTAVLCQPLLVAAQVASNVRLFLPDGRLLTDPVAVSLDTTFTFGQPAGARPQVRVAVDPRYTADLSRRWFEMAAGASFETICGSGCSAQTVDLGTFFITQSFKLTSPDRRPIAVSASWTTLADIDMPVDAWVSASFKLGVLSGGFAQRPDRNIWLQCWANSVSAAEKARCDSPVSTPVPLKTADTRSLDLRVSSGSVMQLEVFGALRVSLPAGSGSTAFSGTMLLDPFMQIQVPAGTIVESSAFPITVVPEPPAAWLALAGLGVLAGAGWRRGQRRR